MATAKTKRTPAPATAPAAKSHSKGKAGKATPDQMGAEDESTGDARASKGKSSLVKPKK